jgi:hypothetical protein
MYPCESWLWTSWSWPFGVTLMEGCCTPYCTRGLGFSSILTFSVCKPIVLEAHC